MTLSHGLVYGLRENDASETATKVDTCHWLKTHPAFILIAPSLRGERGRGAGLFKSRASRRLEPVARVRRLSASAPPHPRPSARLGCDLSPPHYSAQSRASSPPLCSRTWVRHMAHSSADYSPARSPTRLRADDSWITPSATRPEPAAGSAQPQPPDASPRAPSFGSRRAPCELPVLARVGSRRVTRGAPAGPPRWWHGRVATRSAPQPRPPKRR